MPEILSFDVVNPLLDNKLPFYNVQKGLLYIPGITNKYRYYLECARNIPKVGRRYYLLLNGNKFNKDCRRCNTDGYGRLVINPRGEFKDYLEDCCAKTRNIEIGILESTDIYDIYYVNADNM